MQASLGACNVLNDDIIYCRVIGVVGDDPKEKPKDKDKKK